MKLSRLLILVAVVTLVFIAGAARPTAHGQTGGLRAPGDFDGIADRDARAKALFIEIGKVLQHPRCVNCHPKGDRPLQGETGYPHQPLVQRGDAKGRGITTMRCTTCHQEANFDPGRVPGGEDWRLADSVMAWQDQSVAQICAQILNPERNGNHGSDWIVDHLKHHALVGWAWEPGRGRDPAPGTWKEFRALVDAWNESGGKCP